MPQKTKKKPKDKSPRSIPRTQQDCDRAEQKGRLFGIDWAINLFLFILKDKHDATDAELDQFRDEFNEYLDLINRGEIKLRDVKGALKFEYNTEVKL